MTWLKCISLNVVEQEVWESNDSLLSDLSVNHFANIDYYEGSLAFISPTTVNDSLSKFLAEIIVVQVLCLTPLHIHHDKVVTLFIVISTALQEA